MAPLWVSDPSLRTEAASNVPLPMVPVAVDSTTNDTDPLTVPPDHDNDCPTRNSPAPFKAPDSVSSPTCETALASPNCNEPLTTNVAVAAAIDCAEAAEPTVMVLAPTQTEEVNEGTVPVDQFEAVPQTPLDPPTHVVEQVASANTDELMASDAPTATSTATQSSLLVLAHTDIDALSCAAKMDRELNGKPSSEGVEAKPRPSSRPKPAHRTQPHRPESIQTGHTTDRSWRVAACKINPRPQGSYPWRDFGAAQLRSLAAAETLSSRRRLRQYIVCQYVSGAPLMRKVARRRIGDWRPRRARS